MDTCRRQDNVAVAVELDGDGNTEPQSAIAVSSTRMPSSQNSISSLGSVSFGGRLSLSVLSPQAMLSQRIVSVEYYMCHPVKEFDNVYSDFRNSTVKRVPIIRIFGSTPAGQKMCANIHGVYPYVSVLDDEYVEGIDYRLASALDAGINESVVSNKFQNSRGNYAQATQHVFKIVRVVGKTFYGFRSEQEVFLRIYFYNPMIVKKAVDLLQSGSILGRRFQPYEAHIPYNLQFMIDYGLYGMNFVNYSSLKFRKSCGTLKKQQHECLKDLMSTPSSQESNYSSISRGGGGMGFIDPDNIEEHLLAPPQLVKQTLCELEVDVIASDIVITTACSEKTKSDNPGIDCIWKDEVERRRLHGLEECSQISIPESQERSNAVLVHKTEDKYRQVLWGKVDKFFTEQEVEYESMSQKMSQSSSIEGQDLVPSSQVLHHFPHESNREMEDSQKQGSLPEEDDELTKLLEEIVKDFEFGDDEASNGESEGISVAIANNPDLEIAESEGQMDTEVEIEDDSLWDDTFLSQTILQKISDAEALYEEEKANNNEETELNAKEIDVSLKDSEVELFQCDGQGNESETEHSSISRRKSVRGQKDKQVDNSSSPKRSTRRSGKAINVESPADTKNSSRRHSESSPFDKPTLPRKGKVTNNRLSLTHRRLVRSQELEKSQGDDSTNQPKTNSEPTDVGKQVEVLDQEKSIKSKPINQGKLGKLPIRKTPRGAIPEQSKDESDEPTNTKPRVVTPEASNRKSPSSSLSMLTPGKVSAAVQKEIIMRSPVIRLKKVDDLPIVPIAPIPITSSKRERKIPKRFLYQDEFEVQLPSIRSSQSSAKSECGEPVSSVNVDDKKEKVIPTNNVTSDKAQDSERNPRRLRSRKKTVSDKADEANVKSRKNSLASEKPEDLDPISSQKSPRKAVEKIEKVVEEQVQTGISSKRGTRRNEMKQKESKTAKDGSEDTNVTEESNNETEISRQITRSKSFIGKLRKDETLAKDESLPSLKAGVKDKKAEKEKPEPKKSDSFEIKVATHPSPAKVQSPEKADETPIPDASSSRKITRNKSSALLEQIKTETTEKEKADLEQKEKKAATMKKLDIISVSRSSKTPAEPAEVRKRLGVRVTTMTTLKSSASASSPVPAVAAAVRDKDVTMETDLDPVPVRNSSPTVTSTPAPEPIVIKTYSDNGCNTDTKIFSDAGVSSEPLPVMISKEHQTDPVLVNHASAQVEPTTSSKLTQVPIKTFETVGTQTESQKTFAEMDCQTDAVIPLCLCQCKCVNKPKQDASNDLQEDLKPEMKNQRIQVDNVDMITAVRSSRFTTPQSNRIRSNSKTPVRSPEKRRYSRDSPIRRPKSIMTPSPHGSRYLQALGMKTPSGNMTRYRNYGMFARDTSQTPPGLDERDVMPKLTNPRLTPPSRESKEVFLAKVINSTSPSPRKKFAIKPRNLEVGAGSSLNLNRRFENSWDQTPEEVVDLVSEELVDEINEEVAELASEEEFAVSIPQQPDADIVEKLETPEDASNESKEGYVDLSICSIYEYDEEPDRTIEPESETSLEENEVVVVEDESVSGCTSHVKSPLDYPLPSLPQGTGEIPSTPQSIQTPETPSPTFSHSTFQQKRIISRERTKYRIERRKVANIEANRGIPDVFQSEYEPLKQPPSYKSLTKWLDAVKSTPGGLKKLRSRANDSDDEDDDNKVAKTKEEKWFREDSSSDEEECLKPIKLFGGGGGDSLSDDSASDSSDSSSASPVVSDKDDVVKGFTPPKISEIDTDEFPLSQSQQSIGSQNGTPTSILRDAKGTPATAKRLFRLSVLKRKIRWEDEPTGNSDGMEDSDSSQTSSKKRLKLDDESSQESGNKTADQSELDGPSFKNALGLESSSSNLQDCKALHSCQFLTTMCIELHCSSRQGLTPDPSVDSILAIFVLITSDYPEDFRRPRESLNLLVLDKENNVNQFELFERNQKMIRFTDEVSMIDAFVDLVRYWDPDIFVGYEVEKASFGYLIQRGYHLSKDLPLALSRILPQAPPKSNNGASLWRQKDEWNGAISGRIVLNLWRLLRHEISVQSYTFENAAYHILRRRVYKFPQITLAAFWAQKATRHKVIQYYTIRIQGVIQIMDKLDLINRTSELARLFGIQFYEVLSRGSQYRVESMMLRATKPQDYIAPSPGVMQRAKMRAPEYLPLIMEPRSNFYTDPVAVLDFQSLYPSMMIAYNYDYASVLGRVEHLGSMDHFPLGCLDMQISPAELLKLRDHIHISPCGVAFLDKSIVRGVVPEMLEQILETRQMVKRSMKRWKNEGASLHKVLDSRQLGLKLIANVTYGYTSANFSGRMPCVEIADSIVSKGRETLQRAIDFVKENYHRWGGEVIYGDTDSMFILFKGRSREEAFKLAYEIADEVTQQNPKPVKLKFEKIYQPCILQSKKRYVGFAYETPDQESPNYDAKGIETVRRDGCPAVRKILERTLHILFTKGKDKVEQYVKLQFEKLFKGRVSMQDYVFAREFRGRSGYKPGACVPSLEIAKRLTLNDPRAEPLVSERVPYVVIYGNPSLPLIKLVRTPEEYMDDPTMRLNAHYYIEKVIIPALNRCLSLAKLDATKWYLQLPRKYLRNVLDQNQKGKKMKGGQSTLDDYVLHQNCMRCGERAGADRGLCSKCLGDERGSTLYLMEILHNSRSKLQNCEEICLTCSGENGKCVSVDCPILHKLTRYRRDQAYMKTVEKELSAMEW